MGHSDPNYKGEYLDEKPISMERLQAFMVHKICPECSTVEALKEAGKQDGVSTQCCSDECAERRYMRFAEGKEPPKKTRDFSDPKDWVWVNPND